MSNNNNLTIITNAKETSNIQITKKNPVMVSTVNSDRRSRLEQYIEHYRDLIIGVFKLEEVIDRPGFELTNMSDNREEKVILSRSWRGSFILGIHNRYGSLRLSLTESMKLMISYLLILPKLVYETYWKLISEILCLDNKEQTFTKKLINNTYYINIYSTFSLFILLLYIIKYNDVISLKLHDSFQLNWLWNYLTFDSTNSLITPNSPDSFWLPGYLQGLLDNPSSLCIDNSQFMSYFHNQDRKDIIEYLPRMRNHYPFGEYKLVKNKNGHFLWYLSQYNPHILWFKQEVMPNFHLFKKR